MLGTLGVTFDEKLLFNVHVNNITNGAYKMLGFLMRTSKNFNNIKCINMLYNSMVRSQLEYLTPIWNPCQQTNSYEIERIQRKFTRVSFFKQNIPYLDYNERLVILGYSSLADRRKYYDMCLLHNIIHKNTLNELSNQLIYRDVTYHGRYYPLFRPGSSRTNYGNHRNICNRLQLTFITEFDDIDILNLNFNDFKREILQII